MIVQCDKCQQQFDVPTAVLQPSGRKLKCASCGNLFFQAPPALPSAGEDAQDGVQEAIAEEDAAVKVSQETDAPEGEAVNDLETLLHSLGGEEENLEEAEDPFSLSEAAAADAGELPVEEESDLLEEEEGQEPLEAVLADLQAAHLEEDALPPEEEEEWATSADELGEIDVDGDPALRALEAMESDEVALMTEEEAAEAEATGMEPGGAADIAEDLPEPAFDEDAETQLVSSALDEEVPEPAFDEDLPEPAFDEDAETQLASSALDEEVPEPAFDEDLPEPAFDEDAETQLATHAGRVEEGAATDREVEEEAAAHLSEPDEFEEDLEDEDALVASAREGSHAVGADDLLPEAEPWPDEAEPWPDEGETAPPEVASKFNKIEPQFDLPEEEEGVPNVVLLAKGSRPEEGMSAGPVAKPAVSGPMAKRKRVAAPTGQGGAKYLWIAVAVLLVLAAGLLTRTDWWEYAWFNWRSPYQLSALDASWRKHSFGHLLLVEGEVTNKGGSASPPWVHVSLLDGTNKPLLTTQVVPGRVVDRRILEGSGEQAIQAMIQLQGQERTPSESTWTGKQVLFQAIFINPPGDAVRFQVDFSGTGQTSGQQRAQKGGATQL